MSNDAAPRPKTGNELWGIYHTDREYARQMGDPLRTVVEAPSKLAAEEAAMGLGFGDPWASRVKTEDVKHAQWRPDSEIAASTGIRPAVTQESVAFTASTPAPYEVEAAIVVLRKFLRHLDAEAQPVMDQIRSGQHCDADLRRRRNSHLDQLHAVEQITRSLKKWAASLGRNQTEGRRHGIRL